MIVEIIRLCTTLLLAILFGGSVTFSLLFAPLVFAKLPSQIAGRFIREVFPWYYLFLIASSSLCIVLLIMTSQVLLSLLMLCVTVAALYSRFILMPKINQLRDEEMQGNLKAGELFKRYHRYSVWLNAGLIVISAFILLLWT